MCGITGIFAFNLVGRFNKIHVANATQKLENRGPDFQDIYTDEWVALGHRRLSIIDTTTTGRQPMWDPKGRYCIVFNGEIFNYRELRKNLEENGISFTSQSDTEVLLNLYIQEKETCLNRLNGFFSFCVYDKQEQTFFLARDRYGIKPILYQFDENKFIFASEMKSLWQYGLEKVIDYSSLYTFLQLNYIPAPNTILKDVKKLMPGHCAKVSPGKLEIQEYYSVPKEDLTISCSYDQAKEKLSILMEESVKKRLVSDVPLGTFLSGGIDSSVVTALASRHKSDLHSFSIGFKDEKFFDETEYATLVARKLKTEHTVFSLTNDDLFKHVHSILDYIDEPFADSSAIAVYILSKETRRHVTVALSGDGADELLGGYNKHAAFYRTLHPGIKENIVAGLHPLWKILPKSRNSKIGNKFRQLARFAEGMKLSPQERYWRWAGYTTEPTAYKLLSENSIQELDRLQYKQQKMEILKNISASPSMNDILYTDMQLVLPNDMLTKVDLMSMANSLEIRVPFLDVDVVNFVSSLPDEFKINQSIRKRVLQDAFRDVLPPELYNRPKKGFEVPLLKWFRKEMKSLITDDLLSEKLIIDQQIFNYSEIQKLKKQLFSSNPGDVHARIWGLIVFQSWWKKYLA